MHGCCSIAKISRGYRMTVLVCIGQVINCVWVKDIESDGSIPNDHDHAKSEEKVTPDSNPWN